MDKISTQLDRNYQKKKITFPRSYVFIYICMYMEALYIPIKPKSALTLLCAIPSTSNCVTLCMCILAYVYVCTFFCVCYFSFDRLCQSQYYIIVNKRQNFHHFYCWHDNHRVPSISLALSLSLSCAYLLFMFIK